MAAWKYSFKGFATILSILCSISGQGAATTLVYDYSANATLTHNLRATGADKIVSNIQRIINIQVSQFDHEVVGSIRVSQANADGHTYPCEFYVLLRDGIPSQFYVTDLFDRNCVDYSLLGALQLTLQQPWKIENRKSSAGAVDESFRAVENCQQQETHTPLSNSNAFVAESTSTEICHIGVALYTSMHATITHRREIKLLQHDETASFCGDAQSAHDCLLSLAGKEAMTSEDFQAKITKLSAGLFSDKIIAVNKTSINLSDANLKILYKTGTAHSAATFMDLIEVVNELNETQIIRKLKNKNSRLSVLNLLAYCTTPVCHKTVTKFLNLTTTAQEEEQELYFTMLAQQNKLDNDALAHVIEIITNTKFGSSKVHFSAMLCLGALARQSCSTLPSCVEKTTIVQWLMNKLNSCTTNDSNCKSTFLAALRNVGHLPSLPVPELRAFICDDALQKVPYEALQVLNQQTVEDLSTDEVSEILWSVYEQRCASGSDSSVVTVASSILVRILSYQSNLNMPQAKATLTRLLDPLQAKDAFKRAETYSYIIEQLTVLAQRNDNVSTLLRTVVREKSLNNYLLNMLPFALSGVADARFLSNNELNISYAMEMEFQHTVLKRSAIDVFFDTGKSRSRIFSFGLFARGLESLIGDTPSSDSEEITAGMRLEIFGLTQRPLVFFTGQGALMSAVWNHADPNKIHKAFEGNFLLHDTEEIIVLPSGLPLRFHVKGALSLLLNGQLDVSLWYRTSHSVVSNKGGLAMNIAIGIPSAVPDYLDMSLETDIVLDTVTDLDFSTMPLRMCLRLDQHPFEIKQKSAIVSSAKRQDVLQYKTKIWGHTFQTHKKVSHVCQQLLTELGL